MTTVHLFGWLVALFAPLMGRLFSITILLFALMVSSKAGGSIYTPDPWERQVVAACLILEAADQGRLGMTAVANVISNRAHGQPSRFYREIRRPYQFSALNQATTGKISFAPLVRRASRDRNWGLALELVDLLYMRQLPDVTGQATHYLDRRAGKPEWTRHMEVTVVIGDHKFLRHR